MNAAKLAAGAVGGAALQDNGVTAGKIANQAVGTAAIDFGAVGVDQLAPEATTTLYSDDGVADLTINSDTPIAALSLPAGTYLMSAGVQAVHSSGTTNYTRLECYIQQSSPSTTIDFAKLRLEPNTDPNASLVFAKAMLQGPATLPSATGLVFRCTTTGAARARSTSAISTSRPCGWRTSKVSNQPLFSGRM